MTIYYVNRKEFFTASAAKKYAKELIKDGVELNTSIVKVYSNGDWVNCGELKLSGSNKHFIANSPRNMNKENY